jgi:hypothetical protein
MFNLYELTDCGFSCEEPKLIWSGKIINDTLYLILESYNAIAKDTDFFIVSENDNDVNIIESYKTNAKGNCDCNPYKILILIKKTETIEFG